MNPYLKKYNNGGKTKEKNPPVEPPMTYSWGTGSYVPSTAQVTNTFGSGHSQTQPSVLTTVPISAAEIENRKKAELVAITRNAEEKQKIKEKEIVPGIQQKNVSIDNTYTGVNPFMTSFGNVTERTLDEELKRKQLFESYSKNTLQALNDVVGNVGAGLLYSTGEAFTAPFSAATEGFNYISGKPYNFQDAVPNATRIALNASGQREDLNNYTYSDGSKMGQQKTMTELLGIDRKDNPTGALIADVFTPTLPFSAIGKAFTGANKIKYAPKETALTRAIDNPYKYVTKELNPYVSGIDQNVGFKFADQAIDATKALQQTQKTNSLLRPQFGDVVQPQLTVGATQAAAKEYTPWTMQEMPGYHLQSTMSNNPKGLHTYIAKDGTIDTKSALDHLKRIEGDERYNAVISGLQNRYGINLENMPKRIDYNILRKNIQDDLWDIGTGKGQQVGRYAGMDMKSYGILKNNQPFLIGQNPATAQLKKLPSLGYEEGEVVLDGYSFANKNKFIGGSTAHDMPSETLGHSRSFTNPNEPGIYYSVERQSNWAQEANSNIVDPLRGMLTKRKDIYDRLLKNEKSLTENIKEQDALIAQGKEWAVLQKERFEEQLKSVQKIIKEHENYTNASLQEKLVMKNMNERMLQEDVAYAASKGNTKYRMPSEETMAKIQGWSRERVFSQEAIEQRSKIMEKQDEIMDELDILYNIPKDKRSVKDTEIIDFLEKKHRDLNKEIREINESQPYGDFNPAQKTILKHTSQSLKDAEKLYGVKLKPFTDSKGNTWFEFDIPDAYKQGKAEIKAFNIGGIIGTGAAGASIMQQPKEKFRTGGAVNPYISYNNGGKVIVDGKEISTSSQKYKDLYDAGILMGVDSEGLPNIYAPKVEVTAEAPLWLKQKRQREQAEYTDKELERYMYQGKVPERDKDFLLPPGERLKIYNAVLPFEYPDKEFPKALKRYITGEERKFLGQKLIKKEDRDLGRTDEDAWAHFMGLPQLYNTVDKSEYLPTDSKNKNAEYYTIRKGYPDFDELLLENAHNWFQRKENTNANTLRGVGSPFMPLENVTYSKGQDKKGKYYSMYDVYDFNVPYQKGIGKPYEIYDRVYYDDTNPDKPVVIGKEKKTLKVNPYFKEYKNGGKTENPPYDPTTSYVKPKKVTIDGKEMSTYSNEYRDLYNTGNIMPVDYEGLPNVYGPQVNVTAEAPDWLKEKRRIEAQGPIAEAVRKGRNNFATGLAQGVGAFALGAGEIMNTPLAALGEVVSGRNDFKAILPNMERALSNVGVGEYKGNQQMTPGNALFPNNPIAAMVLDVPVDILLTRGANTLFKQGLKQAPKITKALGIPSKFKSEIDWSKWNKEIPSNKDLMKEYTAIEKSSKANGTWMKNADGSAYQGTPEQFVQENSSNFKKAFPEGFDKTYRGAQFLTPRFDRTAFQDKDIITFGTSDESVAKRYATNHPANLNDKYQDIGEDVLYWHPDVDVEKQYRGWSSDAKAGLYEILYPKGQKTINAEGQGNRWFNIKQDDVFEGIKQNDYKNFRGEDYRKYFDPSSPIYWGNEMTYGNVATDDMASYMIKNDIPVGKVSNVYDGRDYFGNPKPANVTMLNTSVLPVKSRWYNNGMFDMTNPNIFKVLVPAVTATGTAATIGTSQLNQQTPQNRYGGQNPYIKYANGGPVDPVDPEDKDAAMRGMMKARMAIDSTLGRNPAAMRMTSVSPKEYTFTGDEMFYDEKQNIPAGATGTHYTTGEGNVMFPIIQEGQDGNLFFNRYASPTDKEAMRFETPEEASYFGENYKSIAPMMYNKKEYEKGGNAESTVEIERSERVYTPNGKLIMETPADAPTHEEGGVKVTLPAGSLVFPKKYYKALDAASGLPAFKKIAKTMLDNAEKAYLRGEPYSSGGKRQ